MAQKTIDFENDILRPIGSLKEDLVNAKSDLSSVESILFDVHQDNLIDVTRMVDGVLGSNGFISTSTVYKTTDFERVIPNTIYSGWQRYGALSLINPCVCDMDKNFISSLKVTNSNTVTIPENAYYLRTSLENKQIAEGRKPRIVQGGENKEYKPYKNDFRVPVRYLKKEEYNKCFAFLPDIMYCAVGTTIDIYNNQVCINANKFHFQWLCDVGINDKRKFTVTGKSAGNHNLTLNIYNDELEIVWTKTIILKVVNQLATSKTINPIGDSMTYGGGQWLAEIQTTLSTGKIAFVGTQEMTFRENTYKHEGRNGYSASDYAYTSGKNSLGNPYFNAKTNAFDWSYYKTQNALSPDAVMIELGTNGISLDSTENVTAIKSIVDNIRSTDTSVKIYICNAIYRSGQDGICRQVNSQGYVLDNTAFKYEEDMKIFNLMNDLYETLKDYTHLYFIPLALCHDSENNFGKQSVALNSRSQEKIYVPSDSIHPNKHGEDASTYGYDVVGYLQFADVMWSVFCGTL